MNNYQHKLIPGLDETGFGVKLETNLSAYTPPHWHKALEILLFVKGKVTCNLENATLHAKKGDVYLTNSHEVHATKCSRNAVYLCVHILPSQMVKFVPNFDQLHFSLAFDPGDEEKANAFEQLKTHLMEILRQTEDTHQATHKLEQQASLYAVAAILVKYFSQPIATEEHILHRSDMARLEPLLEYVQLHHGEDLSLDEAAQSVGFNKEYFCRLFKKNMGVTFLQYVYQIRATAVCRELETSEDTIGQIAERHGFRDPKMLNQYFREIYGCTPSEKRKFFREVFVEDLDLDEDD